jgi:hypothetical protein
MKTIARFDWRRFMALAGAVTTLAAPALPGCSAASSEDTASTKEALLLAPPPDKSVTFEVELSTLVADHITDEPGPFNSRDETYVVVRGQTPIGAADAYLPRYGNDDIDYYEFWNGTSRDETTPWTNQDQVDVGYPRIWNGTLQPGQTAGFEVAVMEQDDKNLKDVAGLATAACDLISLFGNNSGSSSGSGSGSDAGKGAGDAGKGGDGGKADGGGSSSGGPTQQQLQGAIAFCKEVTALLPTKTTDDLIGIFQVNITNNDGTLEVNTVPIGVDGSPTTRPGDSDADHTYQAAQLALGRYTDTFYLAGGGGSYRADLTVKKTPTITNPLRYLRMTNDECRQDNFKVMGNNGPVPVPQGGKADIRIGSDTNFHWQCDGSDEHTQCGDQADYVRLFRDGSGGGLHWQCFHEDMVFTKKLGDGFYRANGDSFVWHMTGDSECVVGGAVQYAEFQTTTRNVNDLGTGHTSTGVCAWPHCSNGVKDTVETGTDCGGSTCGKCGVGGGCLADSDCATGLCNALGGYCVASHCDDKKVDADETGVDCGGATCKACVIKSTCPPGTSDKCGDGHCYSSKQLCP